MKECTKCRIKKPATTEFFTKLSSKTDKLRAQCNTCKLAKQKEERNADKASYNKKRNEYLSKNKDKRDEWSRRSKLKNSKQINKNRRIKSKHKYHNNVEYKIKHCLRSRLNKAIKNDYKVGSAVDDLGCSIEELKIHFENLFQEGMTWDNHGEWHIDHIKPLDSFDLTDEEQVKKACHYTNLQPLWAKDNIIKSNN